MSDEMRDDIIEIKAAVGRIEHSLNGNGQPGLKTRVALVERWQANAGKFFWLVVGATVTTLVSAGVALFAAAAAAGGVN